MQQRWQELLNKVDSLNLRERVLVFLSALAVTYLIWDVVIFNPLSVAKSKVDQQLASLEQQIAAMAQEEAALLNAVSADPDRDLKDHIRQLNARMAALDGSLSELSVGLVPVEKLTTILQDVLKQTGALKLESLVTLPVEELQLTAMVKVDGEESNSAGVYKHSASLVIRGGYFDLMRYLQALEAMPWRFYWEELRFELLRHPEAVITLKVYTLTTDEGMFGV